MKLEQEQAALSSIVGTLFSFLTLCLLIGYTVQKCEILINRKDVDILYAVRRDFFSDEQKFTGRQGFNVAVGLTGFDDVKENILLPEYAEIKFAYAAWSVKDDNIEYDGLHFIQSHPCTDAELGLEGTGHAEFMPIQERSLAYVNLYKRKLLCIERHELEIFGSFNSVRAQNLVVTLERCHGKPYCKSDAEIDDFLKGKYLMLLKNRIRFDSAQYSKDAIV